MQISLHSLTKSFGSRRSLDSISLEIDAGQILVLLGPNGAGKTTLLRCLTGITAPETGEILFDGELFQRKRLDSRTRMFIQPDSPYIYPETTVLRHIGMVLRLYQADSPGVEEKVLQLLDDFDLLPLVETKLGTLSRGQVYKAALVALLAADPELWMLDEPFASGMDPRGLTAFRRYAREATLRGRTVIYTTQILELAESFSDRVCILHQGQVHAFGTMNELRERNAQANVGVLQEIFEQLREVST
ncbi:MAG: transporter related [Planctomycetaceae bacterium]|nr:transporter related [Planctomycetaceae bacterium]